MDIYYAQDFRDSEGNLIYKKNPVKAIMYKCRYDCCAGDQDSWRNCQNTDCFLHPFRMGTNPFRQKKEYTEEQLAEMRERMKKAKLAKSANLVD